MIPFWKTVTTPPARIYDAEGKDVLKTSAESFSAKVSGLVKKAASFNPFLPSSVLKPAAEGSVKIGAGVKAAGEGIKDVAGSAARGVKFGVAAVVLIVGLVVFVYLKQGLKV